MKRSLDSSDSLGALMSICPPTDQQSPRNNHNVYSREFQTMLEGLEEEGCIDEPGGHVSEKKRRLSVDQVKALEKNFEVENKLEPDRKVKLAQELGLQPRQVAVWFQNRRARWKTKQLERDYGVLKANYDALKLNHDAIQRDNENLLKEIRELKSKLKEEHTGNHNLSVKDEIILPAEATTKAVLEDDNHDTPPAPPPLYSDGNNITSSLDLEDQEVLNYDTLNETNNGIHGGIGLGASLFTDFKDGSSDSDSSAILNEDNNNSNNIHGSPNNKNLLTSPSSSINCFQFTKTSSFQSQFVKMEEHNFFGDEACNFFSDEQPPSLQWYCSDQWS